MAAGRPNGRPNSTQAPRRQRARKRRDPIAEAREAYRPDRIRLVFVAEAPPPADSDRFFYFENVHDADWLFLNLMRALYLDVSDTKLPKCIRERKRELLERFRADGFYLIDASDRPMPAAVTTPAGKCAILERALPALRSTAAELSDGGRVPFILISVTVHDACRDALVRDGVNVLNSEPIPFPRQQWLEVFHERLGTLLRAHLVPTVSS